MKEHAKASINFKSVKSNSEHHNNREGELGYVHSELTENNYNNQKQTIHEAEKECRDYCKEVSGRKMMANATPIREAVVNLTEHTTKKDLFKLSHALRDNFGIDCFQLHIHRDEGKEKDELNHHAHMLFKWIDKRDEIGGKKNPKHGKVLRLGRADMSRIQDLVAETLGMERGQRKTNHDITRLEAVEYKVQQEEKKKELLQEQNASLEQKKNQARARAEELKQAERKLREVIEKINRDDPRAQKNQGRANEIISLINENGGVSQKVLAEFTDEEISFTIKHLDRTVQGDKAELRERELESEELESELQELLKKLR
jgi:hypothetical protein